MLFLRFLLEILSFSPSVTFHSHHLNCRYIKRVLCSHFAKTNWLMHINFIFRLNIYSTIETLVCDSRFRLLFLLSLFYRFKSLFSSSSLRKKNAQWINYYAWGAKSVACDSITVESAQYLYFFSLSKFIQLNENPFYRILFFLACTSHERRTTTKIQFQQPFRACVTKDSRVSTV